MHEYDEMQRKTLEEGILMDVDLPNDLEKIREIEEKLAKDPHNPNLWAARAAFHWASEFEDAVRCYSRALYYIPLSGEMHFNRARKYMSLHRWEEALAGFELSVRIDPRPAVKWYYHGVSAMVLGKFDVAIESFKKNIEFGWKKEGPNHTAPNSWIWLCYKHLGMGKEAQAILDCVDANSPIAKSDEGYRTRVFLHRGSWSIDKVLKETDPGNALVHMGDLFAVGCHYLHNLNDPRKAIEFFDEVLAIEKNHHAFAWVMAGNEKEYALKK